MRLISYFIVSIMIFNANMVWAAQKDIVDLDLEELMNIKVTSVSKKTQTLSEVASAIYVVSQEDIKRTGVTNIPDALRMVPGLDVGRIDANKWAVSSRGFNGRFANKLLVLIDGRSIYTQTFSGVYWENQDVLLEDVERIEVIRGPGAALWGANAVNGVINIITKHSADTKGGLITAGGGNLESGFGSFRYGKDLGKDTTARLYVKGFQRDAFKYPDKQSANDDWNKVQGGFRVDSLLSPKDNLKLSGDLYLFKANQTSSLPSLNTSSYVQDYKDIIHSSGGNINARYEHRISSTENFSVQTYYDIYKRNETIAVETRQTFNLEFQHQFAFNTWNDVVWGVGYRFLTTEFQFPNADLIKMRSNSRNDHYFNAFIQDELAIVDNKLWLTLGSRLEHNDYTGFEVQPSARLSWVPHKQHRFWGAISRAVRTPSMIDAEGFINSQYLAPNSQQNPSPVPVEIALNGSKNFKAEELIAYELGHRVTLDKAVSIDSTIFYNNYHALRSFVLGELTPDNQVNNFYLKQQMDLSNTGAGETFGFETAIVWQMLDWWRWDVNYSYLNTHFKANPYYKEAITPAHKSSVRILLTPFDNITTDLWLRYVDKSAVFTLNGPVNVGGYLTMDLRVGWKPHKSVELSVTGQNLLDGQHLETLQELYPSTIEVPRGVIGKVTWAF
jgi:iron complex outermembrane receptor protein